MVDSETWLKGYRLRLTVKDKKSKIIFFFFVSLFRLNSDGTSLKNPLFVDVMNIKVFSSDKFQKKKPLFMKSTRCTMCIFLIV